MRPARRYRLGWMLRRRGGSSDRSSTASPRTTTRFVPGYPGELVDEALARGRLGAGARVLEVGCGTGKLTELLAARGLVVDAVDPGPNMIRAAQRRVGDRAERHVPRRAVRGHGSAGRRVRGAVLRHRVPLDRSVRSAGERPPTLRPGGVLALLAHVRRARRARRRTSTRSSSRSCGSTRPDVAETLRRRASLQTILDGADERRGNASEVWDWLMGEQARSCRRPRRRISSTDVEVATRVESIEQTADELSAHLQDDVALVPHRSRAHRDAVRRGGQAERRAARRQRALHARCVFLMTALRAG